MCKELISRDTECAEALLAEEKWEEATKQFQMAGHYKDSAERAKTVVEVTVPKSHYDKAEKYLQNGEYENAIAEFTEAGAYSYAEQDEATREAVFKVHYTLAEQYVEQENWTDIVAVVAGERHSVGLRKDGSVVATGDGNDGMCDVDNPKWHHVSHIAAGYNHTVAVHDDGTVLAVGSNIWSQCDVSRHEPIAVP